MKVDLKVKRKDNDSDGCTQSKSMKYSPDENRDLTNYKSLRFSRLENSKNGNSIKDYNQFHVNKYGIMYYTFFENNRLSQYYNPHYNNIRPLLQCSKHELKLDSMKNDTHMNSVNRICSINSIKQIKNPIKSGISKIKFVKKQSYTRSLVDKLCENLNKYRKLNLNKRNDNNLNKTNYQKFNRRGLSLEERDFKIENPFQKARYQIETNVKKKNFNHAKLFLQIDNKKNNFVKNIKMNQKSFVIHFNKKGRILNTSNLSTNYNCECMNFCQSSVI